MWSHLVCSCLRSCSVTRALCRPAGPAGFLTGRRGLLPGGRPGKRDLFTENGIETLATQDLASAGRQTGARLSTGEGGGGQVGTLYRGGGRGERGGGRGDSLQGRGEGGGGGGPLWGDPVPEKTHSGADLGKDACLERWSLQK